MRKVLRKTTGRQKEERRKSIGRYKKMRKVIRKEDAGRVRRRKAK